MIRAVFKKSANPYQFIYWVLDKIVNPHFQWKNSNLNHFDMQSYPPLFGIKFDNLMELAKLSIVN